MTTDIITVDQDEPIDLVANLMDWQYIRYVLVEDARHKLVGIVSTRSLLRFYANELEADDGRADDPVPVSDVMQTSLVTVGPDCETLEAIDIMTRERIGCLPVVSSEGTLLGLVTENDFLQISKQLIEEKFAR